MLHWSKELIQEYIVNHAHEVNHEMAVKYAHDPPPPDNNDDIWFHQHPSYRVVARLLTNRLSPDC